MGKLRAVVLAGLAALFVAFGPAALADVVNNDFLNDHVTNGACVDVPAVQIGDPNCEERAEAGDPDCIAVPATAVCGEREHAVRDVVVPKPHVHPHPHVHAAAPRRLPVTGANVGDIAALGLAALSGGGVMLRRIRLAFAS